MNLHRCSRMRLLPTFHFVAVWVTGLLTGCNHPVETTRVAIQKDDVRKKVTVSEKRPNQAKAEDKEGEHGSCLSGQVLGERGDPIAGAEVRIGHYAADNVAALTDAEGRFSLEVGVPPADVVLVSAPGKSVELVKLSELPDADELSVTLMPGRLLKLRVVDEQGNPLPGVRVSGDEWRGTALLLHFTTDEDGIIEWKEAPNDAVEFFISKPGYCKLMNLKLVASDTFQDVSLPRVLKIAGRVRDAATGDPIERFKLSPVLQFESGATVTSRGQAVECLDGEFSVEFDRVDTSHAVRIEAEGYRTQMTQMFRVDEPVGEISVELHVAAPLTGVVLTPEGKPASCADVYLATPSMPVELMGGVARGSNNLSAKTDADGRYDFPAQFEQFTIVVIADQGFADAAFRTDEPPGEIRLQAWSRVSGVLTQSGQPAPNQVVELKSIRLGNRLEPRFSNLLRTTTGDDGSYSFARVPPCKYSLQADVSIWRPSDLTSREGVPLDLVPGEARTVQLGGNGIDVVGRVKAVGAAGVDLKLNYSLNYLLHKSAGIVPRRSVLAFASQVKCMATVLTISVGLLLFGHVIGFVQLVRNQRGLAWPAERRCRSSGDRSVCVIVPARNEATDIAACLRSLLAQDYIKLKIIVVNDHSSDETPGIINEIAEGESRMVVIHDPPLQRGWLGKHNAMNAALQHVDSDLLLLTDADVEFDPACISFAVGELERANLSLLSIYPQFEFVSFCETILLPFYVGGAAILLSPAAEDPRHQHAMAVGAFILMRTDQLQKVGGFEPIKTAILDDIVMARTFKAAGFKIGLRSAPDLMRIRFFKGNRHAFFGFTKHLIGSVQNLLWLAPIIALLPLLIYGTLLFAAAYGIMHRQFLLASVAILTLVIHYVALLRTRPGNKFNGFVALAFPLMCVPFAASCLRAAYLLAAKGKFEWRGRETDMRTESIATGERREPPPSGSN